jgi:Icc-related predicted phosphoesterase
MEQDSPMAMTRIFFATDVHGSDKTWLKFLKSANFYKADVLILGGDMTGKAVVPIIENPDGTFEGSFMGVKFRAYKKADLKEQETKITTAGHYIYYTTPKGHDEVSADPNKLDAVFKQLMIETAEKWMRIVDDVFKDSKIKIFVCPGNDDILDIDPILSESDRITNAEGKVVMIDDNHEMISTGWANPTPWHTHREDTEEKLGERINAMVSQLKNIPNSVFAFHVPPYASGLDNAPKLDENMRPSSETKPVGSTAVRKAIEKYQPILSLHGHIHESRMHTRIGRTLCINPGSSYEAGILLGALVNLEKDKVKSFISISG